MAKDIIIIGASGHGRVVADIVRRTGDNIYGFLDDDLSKPNVIGKIDDCRKFLDKFFIIAIGNNEIRKCIAEKYSDLNYYTAIHPMAVISSDVQIGKGTVIMANAVVNASARIGNHCIINTSAVVEHDNVIEDYVHISPNVTLCGAVAVGEKTHIGAGVTVRNNLHICGDAIIGAGAVVVNDILKPGQYIGIPAKCK